jgi:decaprenyl-phosphate phosphoribosyltransferase
MPPVGGGATLPEDVRANALAAGIAPEPSTMGTLSRRRRSVSLRAVLVTMRPKQWIKNALIVAAAGAAGALTHDDVPLRVGLAFVSFCLLASGIYAINDVRDAPEDRAHPRKRFRPVAAGELDPRLATLLGVGLVLAGLALSTAVRPLLGVVALSYVLVTVSYTIVLRRIPILDIAAIAAGFVLRAVAGGVAAPVTLSRWFVLVITSAALLVAAAKRYAELRRTEQAGVGGRPVLERYGGRRLRLIIAGSAAVALFAYCVWAFALPNVNGIPWRPLTIIPFAACLLRYAALIRAGGGEAPEELLLSDRWLALGGVVWLVVFALGVHAAG